VTRGRTKQLVSSCAHATPALQAQHRKTLEWKASAQAVLSR
jgi:hypothetical protein